MIMVKEPPIVYEGDKPVAVLVDYEEYQRLMREVEAARALNDEHPIPHDIAEAQTSYHYMPQTDGIQERRGEVMTVREMYSRFPGEWVLIGEPETTSVNIIQRGTVLWHSKDRIEVDRAFWRYQPTSYAIWFMGPPYLNLELWYGSGL